MASEPDTRSPAQQLVAILGERLELADDWCSDEEVAAIADIDATPVSKLAELLADRLGRPIDIAAGDQLTTLIRSTLENRRISTLYQPIVDVNRRTVAGAEALSRFASRRYRTADWFHHAHRIGAAVDLELLAIESAIAGASSLGERYLGVNASPETICDPRLPGVIAKGNPALTVIEITTAERASSHESLQEQLTALRNLGVRIAVDDVGQQFSDFSHVMDIQPDIIKIDTSLIRNVSTDRARRAMVEAIVSLGSQLGGFVVAEGVETQADLDAVAGLGIAFAQGRFLAKPDKLPLPVITNFARRPRLTLSSFAEFGGHRAMERPFELAVLHSPIGVTIVGLDGAFLHVNPSLSKMLGYSTRDLHRLSFKDITHPEDLGTDIDLLTECLEGSRDHYRIEKRYLRQDGSVVWGDLSVALVRSQGNEPLYFISQVLDITDRGHPLPNGS